MTQHWQGRRVAVTGAAGMTGSRLVARLLEFGARVRALVRPPSASAVTHHSNLEIIIGDGRDPESCARLLDGVDTLVHAAAHRFNVARHREVAGEVSRANVELTLALLANLPTRPEFAVTLFSTAYLSTIPDVVRLQPETAVDGYVVGKYCCELLWLAAAKERRFPLLIVRPTSIYGPGDRFTEDGNVIPSLIAKAASGGESLQIWGSGRQQRSFLYADDAAGATAALMEAGIDGVQYLTSPELVTISDLATRIRDLVSPGLPLSFDASREEGVGRLDSPAVHPILRNYPWTPLQAGLAGTVEWWKTHPSN